MKLEPGEETLYEAPEEDFILTTHRMRGRHRVWGRKTLVSLPVDEIAASRIGARYAPLWIVAAAASFLLGIVFSIDSTEEPFMLGSVGSVLCIVAYLVTGRGLIEFSTARGTVSLRLHGRGREGALELIDLVESARGKRLGALRGAEGAPERRPTYRPSLVTA